MSETPTSNQPSSSPGNRPGGGPGNRPGGGPGNRPGGGPGNRPGGGPGNRPGGGPGNRPGGGPGNAGGRGRSFGRGPGGGGRRGNRDFDKPADDLVEKVVFINRSSKVVKGGRRFSFSALVVTGDQKGKVGVGLGKANEVVESIRKGSDIARRNLETVSILETTIPHEVFSAFGGARILLRPASEGTGVIAGKTVRAVLDAAGVKNVLSKSLGSSNPANVVKGTIAALKQLRRREDIYKDRGIPVSSSEPQATA